MSKFISQIYQKQTKTLSVIVTAATAVLFLVRTEGCDRCDSHGGYIVDVVSPR